MSGSVCIVFGHVDVCGVCYGCVMVCVCVLRDVCIENVPVCAFETPACLKHEGVLNVHRDAGSDTSTPHCLLTHPPPKHTHRINHTGIEQQSIERGEISQKEAETEREQTTRERERQRGKEVEMTTGDDNDEERAKSENRGQRC